MRMNLWGTLTSLDLFDCDPKKLRSERCIKKFVIQLCTLMKVKRYGPCQLVHFGQDPRVKGYSMVQLIETSLVSAHFVERTNTIYLDVFSCNRYSTSAVSKFAKDYFKAKESNVAVTGRYERRPK